MPDETYKIEKGVPIPPERQGHTLTIYPWAQMEISDSFFVPFKGSYKELKAKQASLISCANHYGRRHGMRFTCRRVRGGIRVWRIG